jgi:formimidoylglutamate deiminase
MAALPADGLTYRCAQALVEGRTIFDARIDVDAAGTVVRIGADADLADVAPAPIERDLGPVLLLPGLVNAHSHAFQRLIRGATHRRGADDPSSFWSWREAMYRAASGLDPDALQRATELAFAEMVRAGITCVGEFHYVHHQPDGTPYDDLNELSWRIVEAARSVGIRLVLLEVYYARAGHGQEPLPEQQRFCDGSVDRYLARVEALMARGVSVGITPHSVRAVGRDDLVELARFAEQHDLPFHIHVSEQPRENDECQAEHGMSPTRLLEEVGATATPRRLTAVHAVHIDDDDRRILGSQSVCACPTTEADLGDGVVGARALLDAGCNLALGSDSNAVIDLVQEARLLEMHERLLHGQRLRLNDDTGRLGGMLANVATRGGALALHRPSAGQLTAGCPLDAVAFDLHAPFFAAVAPEHALDALFAAGQSGVVRHVIIEGVEHDGI